MLVAASHLTAVACLLPAAAPRRTPPSMGRPPGCGLQQAAPNTASGLQARRAVYAAGVWALPRAPAAAPTPASPGAAAAAPGVRVSDGALEAWLSRELRALLGDDDVMLLVAYVKGLVNSFGVTQTQTQQQAAPAAAPAAAGTAAVASMVQAATAAAAAAEQRAHGSGAGAPPADADAPAAGGTAAPVIHSAVAVLEVFLCDAAAQFWHELSCFASSGLSMAAWDRAVRYGPPAQQLHAAQPAAAAAPAGSQPAAVVASAAPHGSISGSRPRSGRWDVPPAAAAAAMVAPPSQALRPAPLPPPPPQQHQEQRARGDAGAGQERVVQPQRTQSSRSSSHKRRSHSRSRHRHERKRSRCRSRSRSRSSRRSTSRLHSRGAAAHVTSDCVIAAASCHRQAAQLQRVLLLVRPEERWQLE